MAGLPDWIGPIVEEVRKTRPGPYTVATGVSPSGPIHIGNLREVFIADSVARGLRERGEVARLIYIADSYDPLRKVYPFLPKDYEAHVGKPLSEIPDPDPACSHRCPSYAEHFLRGLDVLRELGIEDGDGAVVEPLRSDRLYKGGRYSEAIRTALDRRDGIARIIAEVSSREVPADWSPFMPICAKCGRLDRTTVTGHDATHADYTCRCGHSGRAPYAGGGKLGWRVDWPARWKILGVSVEPFGKDIGAAGGSHDSGVRIAREAFGIEPPFPIYFEHILLKGDSGGKLSKSAGRTLTAKELLEVMPPAALRTLMTRTPPRKAIRFDPGMELMRDLDDPSFVETEEALYREMAGRERATIQDLLDVMPPHILPSVLKDPEFRNLRNLSDPEFVKLMDRDLTQLPFSHRVTLVQMFPRGDIEGIKKALHRSGFGNFDGLEKPLKVQMDFAQKWLDRWAPDEVKFRVHETLPAAAGNLPVGVKGALASLAGRLENLTAEELHNAIYDAAQAAGAHPKEVFRAIYLSFLGQPSGPRAGWFLSSLDPAFVRRRLEEASR